MQSFNSEHDVLSAMYYDALGVKPDADEGTIKTAFADKFKEVEKDAAAMAKLNKAKACLMNFACRTAYNAALMKFRIQDGASKSAGLQELLPVPTA